MSPVDISHSTSSGLLARVRLQDQDAWAQLVAIYAPLVWRWCGCWHLGYQDREDVVQEVFLAAAHKIATFQKTGPGSFRAWLWTIARNKLRDRYRIESGELTGIGASQTLLQQIPEDLPEPSDDSLGINAKQELLRQALAVIQDRFEPRTWTAFWRATVQQHPPQDIAKDLGMSVDAVYQAKSRILRYLRTNLEGLVDL